MAHEKELLGNHPFEQPFCAQTNELAPLFTAEAYDNTEKTIKEIRLEDYRGRWVVLFFYSSNFTFV
ncbi:alkyl hydroperoxide reductase [Neobacillus notoginsengisoli]|uniref:Alkyl hydroperoxide reductase n=2 Tax=Neobacillus notoginsengisoli TaxID=1578198 RepID=A0A417YS69_9BACI|nr:alkyl hydroperoxide reductase [Neobacillus notoginsengisoli]